MHYIADTMDPLRRVYDFLDPAEYADAVGKPLCDIPCPEGRHASYADHFLAPFLEAVTQTRNRLGSYLRPRPLSPRTLGQPNYYRDRTDRNH